jgi:glycosyltransferase involved in cell wall biosynthesis
MTRVAIITEIPTPYRQPVLDRLLARSDFRFDLIFLARSQADRFWNLDLLDSTRVQVLPGRQWGRPGGHTFFFNRGMTERLTAGRYDLLILGGYAQPALWSAFRYARKRGIPYVLWTESHHHKRRPALLRALKGPWLRNLYGRSAANLVMGAWSEEYVRSYGAPERRIFRFPNSVDAPSFARAVDEFRLGRTRLRESLGLGPGVVALFVGALVERKGVDLLADAIARAGLPLQAVAIGDGPLRRALANRGFRLPGFVQPSDLPKWYAAADFFVLPSREEPYGAVVCEALAAGLPLVCSSSVAAAADCLSQGENGLLFESGSPHGLAEALTALVSSEELRNRMGRASRARSAAFSHALFEANVVDAVSAALEATGKRR